ncbi:MAG: hypothetical protein ACI4RP_08470 [Acutalibacteraceae bacterium]
MPTIIREILKQEESLYRKFNSHQDRRLLYLKNLDKLPKEQQEQERKRIIEKLQKSGIVDKNGEVAAPYRTNEE